jgi:prefoldin subunit 5
MDRLAIKILQSLHNGIAAVKELDKALEAATAEIERLNKEHITLLENASEMRGAHDREG